MPQTTSAKPPVWPIAAPRQRAQRGRGRPRIAKLRSGSWWQPNIPTKSWSRAIVRYLPIRHLWPHFMHTEYSWFAPHAPQRAPRGPKSSAPRQPVPALNPLFEAVMEVDPHFGHRTEALPRVIILMRRPGVLFGRWVPLRNSPQCLHFFACARICSPQ